MSGAPVVRPFPRGPLIGAAALIGLALVTATAARLSGIGRTELAPAAAVEMRELRFEDRADGAVAIYEASDHELVAMVEPGTGGFLRGVLRGFARDRRASDVGEEPPFRLTRWADGRLSVTDPTTGRYVDLGAFGPDNWKAFAQLLETGDEVP